MSDYTCTYCGGELSYDDTFGLGIPFTSSFKEKGEIYQCKNVDENGDALDCYNTSYYIRYGNEDELIEGYPC
jgi:hypothetical protein